MTVGMDMKEIDRLADRLQKAAVRAIPTIEAALTVGALETATQARANAASYGGTGELSQSVEVEESPLIRRVLAEPRQGAFLEYGTPNTGAPRPWLSGPAETAQRKFFAELADRVEPL